MTATTDDIAGPAPRSTGDFGAAPVALPTLRRRPRTLAIVVGACAVVVMLILLVLLVGAGPASAAPPGPTTYSQAVSDAQGLVASVSGGPWNLSSVWGTSVTVPFALNNSIAALGCNVTHGSFGVNNYPAGSGIYSGGQATVWIFSYGSADPAAGTLWVQVVNGTASELGMANGGKCVGYADAGLGTAIDSSTAMHAILTTTNGGRFEKVFPSANATYTLNPGPNPTWVVTLNGCGRSLFGPGTLLASVWASNGTIQNPPREPPVISC